MDLVPKRTRLECHPFRVLFFKTGDGGVIGGMAAMIAAVPRSVAGPAYALPDKLKSFEEVQRLIKGNSVYFES